MNWMINFIAKITGAKKLWDSVSGYKTKIGSVALILSGLAEILQQIVALTDFASVLAFAKAMPTDPSWLAVAAGIAALGIGHKLEKQEKPK